MAVVGCCALTAPGTSPVARFDAPSSCVHRSCPAGSVAPATTCRSLKPSTFWGPRCLVRPRTALHSHTATTHTSTHTSITPPQRLAAQPPAAAFILPRHPLAHAGLGFLPPACVTPPASIPSTTQCRCPSALAMPRSGGSHGTPIASRLDAADELRIWRTHRAHTTATPAARVAPSRTRGPFPRPAHRCPWTAIL